MCTECCECSQNARRPEKGESAELEPAKYTDADYEKIDKMFHENEHVQGATPRHWEDVNVGDKLKPMVKGPLTTTEIIAVHAGGQPAPRLRSSRVGCNRKRIAPLHQEQERRVDVAGGLHWDSNWAKAIGNPIAYDYGVMRQCWFYRQVSDLAGDDGFIERMEDSVRKFNYHGDTQFLTGEVTGKPRGGRPLPRRSPPEDGQPA